MALAVIANRPKSILDHFINENQRKFYDREVYRRKCMSIILWLLRN